MSRQSRNEPYEEGLAELARYLYGDDDHALTRATEAFRSATALAPSDPAPRIALGFVLDAAGRLDEALDALRTAARLDPEDLDVEVFVLTLLSEAGAEAEALAGIAATADRHGVDVDGLRRELAAAGMPADARTLLLNGFIRPRNFVRSRLEDEIERAERKRDPALWARRQEEERRQCAEMQSELQRSLDPERVPADLRRLLPWASRLGVGDDFCRGWLMDRLSADQRAQLLLAVGGLESVIQDWLDGVDPESMPDEAAAVMYLMLAVEEMA